MSSTIRSLVVKVGADLSGFKAGMTQATTGVQRFSKTVDTSQKSMSTFSTAAKSMFAGIGIAAITAGLTRFIRTSTELASNLAEVQNVVDVTFRESAAEINKFAKDAGYSFGLTELSAKKFTGTLGAMLKSSGVTGDALVEMSTKIAALSGDFASFYNIDSDTAFAKIRSGLSGETEPLKQLGINMSVANMEAFALSKGITQAYSSMDQASQTILRYNYLLSVSEDAQGDFTRTAGSYANQLRIADLNMQSFSATMGSGFINIAYGVVAAFNSMGNALQNFALKFETFTRIWFGDAKAIASTNDATAGTTSGLADAQKNLASALKKSSAAAKGSLMAFDQLNVMQGKSAGLSGDAGAAMINYMDALNQDSNRKLSFETELLDPDTASFERKVQSVHDFLYYKVGGGLANLAERWNRFWSDGKFGALEFGKTWDYHWRKVGSGIYDLIDKYALFMSGGKKGIAEMWQDWKRMFSGIGKGYSDFVFSIRKSLEDIGKWISDIPAMLSKAFKFQLPDWYYTITGKQKPSTPLMPSHGGGGRTFTAYATGTNYVPETGPAILHKGEAVIPAAQNNNNSDVLLAEILAAIRSQKTSVNIGNEHFNDYVSKSNSRMALQTGR